MSKDGAVFSKGKIKGEVRFPPFETLDQRALQEIQKYNIYPFGQIQSYCRHIPYNSEKKSFLEKTGRESFEGTLEHLICGSQSLRLTSSVPIRVQSPR